MARPKKYQSVKDLEKKIDSYFKDNDHPTITGLALHLGFTSRMALIRIEGYEKEFSDAIKKAKLRVEQFYENHLLNSNCAGAIFALKNFDWKDKKESEISGEVPINVKISYVESKNNGK